MAAFSKAEILEIILKNLRDIVPELQSVTIDAKSSMRDLGANSLDRADVVIQTIEILGLRIPLNELSGLENIQALVNFLHSRINT